MRDPDESHAQNAFDDMNLEIDRLRTRNTELLEALKTLRKASDEFEGARTGDFHGDLCGCPRCKLDDARATADTAIQRSDAPNDR